MTCGVHLHTVGEGSVAYREGGAENPRRGVPQLMRAAPDSMLVSFLAEPRPIPTPLASRQQFNNHWNTNYPYFLPLHRGRRVGGRTLLL